MPAVSIRMLWNMKDGLLLCNDSTMCWRSWFALVAILLNHSHFLRDNELDILLKLYTWFWIFHCEAIKQLIHCSWWRLSKIKNQYCAIACPISRNGFDKKNVVFTQLPGLTTVFFILKSPHKKNPPTNWTFVDFGESLLS